LGLADSDRIEALAFASDISGRPMHLLEKDVWVVWLLGVLFESPLASSLTFRGGTSLSKAYKVIDRFSEDIDLTYDIRQVIPDLIGNDDDAMPTSRSQGKMWTKEVRTRLPVWITEVVLPTIEDAIDRDGFGATIGADVDKPHLRY